MELDRSPQKEASPSCPSVATALDQGALEAPGSWS